MGPELVGEWSWEKKELIDINNLKDICQDFPCPEDEAR